MILIVSCSQSKCSFTKIGQAIDVYTGPLTRLAVAYARKQGWTPYILSGKYGIISPETIIETYDLKLKAYRGPWPEEAGCWVGGYPYFRFAPPHIKRLFPSSMSYCQMKSELNRIVNPHRYGGKSES
jgi:hypothetical protein